MNNHPIKDCLEILREVRARLRDDLEPGVMHQLDEVILRLEGYPDGEKCDEKTSKEVLELLALFLEGAVNISTLINIWFS